MKRACLTLSVIACCFISLCFIACCFLSCSSEDHDNGMIPVDTVAPAAVTTLAALATDQSSVRISWVATGDDSLTGTASAYDIRYATSPLTLEDWGHNPAAAAPPVPRAPGSVESFTVPGLAAGKTYSIGVRVADEAGNWSPLSNPISASTLPGGDPDAHWWRGFAPAPSGAGMADHVLALAVYRNQVVAGGSFLRAGDTEAGFIARWDGNAWRALGEGTNGPVRALAEYRGDLFAAGDFTEAGGTPAAHIARWDGTAWHAVGAGLAGTENMTVLALATYNGELHAGGTFTKAGGAPAERIARWNGGAWSPVGDGVGGGETARVSALAVYYARLAVGGRFAVAGTIPARNVAIWDGAAWDSLGAGLTIGFSREYPGAGPDDGIDNSIYNGVETLCVYNGQLVAGGSFTRSGDRELSNIAAWNESFFSPLGILIPGSVRALALYDGGLIAAGDFTEAGGLPAGHIARFDGVWHALGTGADAAAGALTGHDGWLYAGGAFAHAGGKPSSFIARWHD